MLTPVPLSDVLCYNIMKIENNLITLKWKARLIFITKTYYVGGNVFLELQVHLLRKYITISSKYSTRKPSKYDNNIMF